MFLVACTALVLAATSALASDAPPQALRTRYPSEEALRRYTWGRLLEERGQATNALGEYYRGLLLDERSPSFARRVSELSAAAGENQRALEFAERAIALDPGDARSLWLKGSALINLGRDAEAVTALESACRADSETAEYFRTLARAAERLDRVDLVARAWRRAVWLDDEDGEGWFQLAAAEARLGRFASADTALRQAVDLNPLRPGLFFLQGWTQESLGHDEQARAFYRQHLAIHADDQTTRRRLVNLLVKEKQYDEALREARIIARARPDDPEARQAEADLVFRAGNKSEGLRLVKRWRDEHPEDAEVTALAIGVLARNGQGKRAAEDAEAWAKASPQDFRRWLIAGRARDLEGRTDVALTHYRRAQEIAPDSLEPRVMLARFHQAHQQLGEAEKVWSAAASRFPDVVGLRLDLALCREQLGDIGGAEAAVRDAIARDPENPVMLNFLSYLLADHNQKLDEALVLIRRALDSDPQNSAFLDTLGWTYFRLGRLQDARQSLEQALRLGATDPVVHEHLGDVYKELRLNDLAKGQYRMSLATDGANARVKAKLAGLR